MNAVSAAAPAIEARSITKRFGPVVACAGVDLAVHRGEIHGVLGQNGAGKTTLMNVLLGLTRPDAGEVLVDGRPVAVHDPHEAARLGIAMVHQHFSLIGALTVWENVTLGERGRVDARATIRRVEETAARYGLDVDARARVDELTLGERQRVEIVKGLLREPDVFILDEPTAVLTTAESLELFRVLRTVVQEEQRAVILISHKLDEVLRATDRVTVMRDGAVVAHAATVDTDAGELAREMVGPAAVPVALAREEHAPPTAAVALALHGLSARGRDGRTRLEAFDLAVRGGEIVGLAGSEGNGQTVLADLLSSLLHATAGTVDVCGHAVVCGRAGAFAAAGVAVVPEDRADASIPELSVAENLAIGALDEVCTGRFVNRSRLRARAERLLAEFEISVPSVDVPFASLSGGNQQRVVLARELSRDPSVLVAAQPTRGLDIRAVEYVARRLRAAAARGIAVLLISTELDELAALADRVVAIHRGRNTGELDRAALDAETLGHMIGGRATRALTTSDA
jgi:simple sugar transport system ATP-binding protein